MKRSMFYVLSAFTLIVIMSVQTTIPARATAYSPGVKAGDYVKYAPGAVSFVSNDTSVTDFIKDFKATAYFRLDVQSVSGNNVTVKSTQHYNNGTADKIQTQIGNVQTGTGNLTSGFAATIIAGGLGKGDKLSTSTSAPTINQTVTGRTEAGAGRDVNLLDISLSFGGSSSKYTAYWDKSTGVLVEIAFSGTMKSGSSSQYTTTFSASISATETNLWSATILGLSPIIFYGIIGAIVAVVVIVGVVLVLRMRKPPTPATTSPTSPATPTG